MAIRYQQHGDEWIEVIEPIAIVKTETDIQNERIDALEKRLGELEKFIAQLLTVAAKRMTEL